MLSLLRTYRAVCVSLLLIAAVTGARALVYAAAPDAEPYHAAVRDAARQAPLKIGDWIGRDIAVPRGVMTVLQPNVILSRRFYNAKTEQQVSVLIVQCADARELLGHYPPNCYRSQGWMQQSAKPRDWRIDGLALSGVEYQFATGASSKAANEVFIENFMVLPDGSTCRDMKGVNAAAKDFRRRDFGAAQFQLVSNASMTPQERQDVWEQVVRAHRHLIDAIRTGDR
jgi:hypothetical protein